jgi:hypothetical protein
VCGLPISDSVNDACGGGEELAAVALPFDAAPSAVANCNRSATAPRALPPLSRSLLLEAGKRRSVGGAAAYTPLAPTVAADTVNAQDAPTPAIAGAEEDGCGSGEEELQA